MKRLRQWFRLACLLSLSVAMAGEAQAQATNYPNRPVRLISDSSPGSAVDVGLRVIADGMSQHWGQQVIVVNQPGAGGAISARVAAQAAPDGYTLYAPALSVFLAVPGKAPNLPLMIPRDFAAVGYTVDQPLAVGVSPNLGVNTLSELIEMAKKRPGELSYAVTGVGRLTHLTGELLQLRTGIKLQMVPYSGNSAQAVADVYAGRIPIMIEGYTGLAPAFQSGNLKPLAVGAGKRLPSTPDLPTIGETLPGLIASGWQAVLTPNGTPEAVIAKASEGLNAALNMAQVKDRLAARGSFVRPMSPAEVTAFIREQQELWKPAIARIAEQMK
ncbi:MAG: tripartite tricarboxylate transporter substrate binding protein [Rhizobiales bacterium]|nr:tripartite tricarboxylate transporter substrate binding protein [Hyphomicrobiales bacterium]